MVESVRQRLCKLFQESKGDLEQVVEQFKASVGKDEDVPLLNIAEEMPESGSLVRFRCFVQDNSFNAQKYLTHIMFKDSESNQDVRIPTIYADSIPEEELKESYEIQEIDFFNNENKNIFAEKYPFFAVSVPGEADWIDGEENINKHQSFSKEMINDIIKEKIPLSIQGGKNLQASILKFYGNEPSLHLCDIIEVIGVLDIPSLKNMENSNNTEVENDLNDMLSLEGTEQEVFNNIPRIHVIYHNIINSGIINKNPNANQIDSLFSIKFNEEQILKCKKQIIKKLSNILNGDKLIAEFILLNCLSKIHHFSSDETPIGYLPINIIGIKDIKIIEELSLFLKSILPLYINFDLNLKQLNEDIWILPAKNRELIINSKIRYKLENKSKISKESSLDKITEEVEEEENDEKLINNNKDSFEEMKNEKMKKNNVSDNIDLGVSSGIFQLPQGSSILINELSLNTGNLNSQGITNLHSISKVINNGKLDYIIEYGELKCTADYKFIVISEGKSMFGIDCSIPINENIYNHKEIEKKEEGKEEEFDIELIRNYLKYLPLLKYEIPEELTKKIADDYVKLRKENNNSNNGPSNIDLSRCLELSRLISRSKGEMKLTVESWKYACNIDKLRLNRLNELKQRKFNNNNVSLSSSSSSSNKTPLTSTIAPAALV